MDFQKKIPDNISFPPVQYAHFPIKQLTPAQIDELLANGYFRNGLNVFSALGRYVDGLWKPCLMLRISLQNFKWKKRSRKLLRRNKKIFEVKIRPLRPRPEMDDLWKLFKTEVHRWNNVPKITDYLLRGLPASNFQTHELGVYFQGQMVAFSIFDKGTNSIASLEAAYHPDFQTYSLGYFTMLLELSYAMESGLTWYYPGFYPKEVPMFEYKLRPGGSEFFDLKNQLWRPFDTLTSADWLSEAVEARLEELALIFQAKGMIADIQKQFHANVPGEISKVDDHQVFLELIKMVDKKGCQRIRIGYDIMSEMFEIFGQEMVLKNSFSPSNLSGQRFVASGPFQFVGSFHLSSQVVDKCLSQVNGKGKI